MNLCFPAFPVVYVMHSVYHTYKNEFLHLHALLFLPVNFQFDKRASSLCLVSLSTAAVKRLGRLRQSIADPYDNPETSPTTWEEFFTDVVAVKLTDRFSFLERRYLGLVDSQPQRKH